MPGDRRGTPGVLVDCYCGLEKYGKIPHPVSLRTRYRHMAEADTLEAEQAAQVTETMDIDHANDQSNYEIEENHPQEFGTGIGLQRKLLANVCDS